MCLVFLGKKHRDIVKKIEQHRHQIDQLSSIVTEQSRLIVSLSLVQSDIAKSVSQREADETERDYFTIRIPMVSDEVLN